jgi:hypothetical protein
MGARFFVYRFLYAAEAGHQAGGPLVPRFNAARLAEAITEPARQA